MRVLLAKALAMGVTLGSLVMAMPASAATHTLSGIITDSRHRPIVGLGVEAEVDDLIITTITDPNGAYSFTFRTGSVVTLRPTGATSGVELPDTFWLTFSPLIVDDDKRIDIVLPVVAAHVQVRDADGAPVEGAIVATMDDVSACNLRLDDRTACGHAETQGTTDAEGNVILWLFPRPADQPYRLQIVPSRDSGLPQSHVEVAVPSSRTATFVLE